MNLKRKHGRNITLPKRLGHEDLMHQPGELQIGSEMLLSQFREARTALSTNTKIEFKPPPQQSPMRNYYK